MVTFKCEYYFGRFTSKSHLLILYSVNCYLLIVIKLMYAYPHKNENKYSHLKLTLNYNLNYNYYTHIMHYCLLKSGAL